jgi:hypothetical protein
LQINLQSFFAVTDVGWLLYCTVTTRVRRLT